MIRSSISLPALAALSALALPSAARAVDWSSVKAVDMDLFYPGQSSYEWALTPSDMSGAEAFRQRGKNCDDCHTGEEAEMGAHVVTGKTRVFKTTEKPPIEPTPIAGKPGSIPARIKVATDDANFYVQLSFQEGTQPDAGQDKAFATKVTVMLIPDTVPEGVRMGCWAACHDDAATMPSAGGADRTKYLAKTRAKITRQGGGDALAPADQLAKLKAGGYFLEYWQAKLNPGATPVAAEGIIFDRRTEVPNAVTAEAAQADGTWTVTLSSKLHPGEGLIDLTPGRTYHLAVAIHAGHTAKRFHYVSMPRTLSIGPGKADLVALPK